MQPLPGGSRAPPARVAATSAWPASAGIPSGGLQPLISSTLRSLYYRTRPATLTEGYDVTSLVRVKPGKAHEYFEFWNKYNKPVYEQLFNDGTITSFGLCEDMVRTAAPGLRVSWYVVPNAAALDKIETAFARANAARSREESEEIGRAYGELVDRDSHRDEMSRVISYCVKRAAGSTDQ